MILMLISLFLILLLFILQLVFDYFCARTPRSYVESRDTSLVWNYKYAGIIFVAHLLFPSQCWKA